MGQSLIIANADQKVGAINKVADLPADQVWEIRIRRYKPSRSLQQNALYWKWLGIIAQDTGHDADEIHEFCKIKFLPPVFVEINGEVHEARRTTTKLKVDEMSAYMDRVYAWATSELGMVLPIPEERHAA